MTLLGAKRPGAWRPRDVLWQQFARDGLSQLLLLQVLLLLGCQRLVLPSSLQLAAVLQLHHCVTALLRYCVTALLHYCITALSHYCIRGLAPKGLDSIPAVPV